MHRTHRMRKACYWGLLLTLLSGPWIGSRVHGQDPQPVLGALPKAVTVNVGGYQDYQMASKKNIARGISDKPDIVRLASVAGQPNTVRIAGLQPGLAHVTLADADNATETLDVVVQVDVEYLQLLLKRNVPTANIQLSPSASGTVIFTGTVARPEDISLASDIARSVIGDRIINNLRVAGPQQVQLDVVLATVSRSKSRSMFFNFQQSGAQHFITSTLGLSSTASGSSTVGVGSSAGALSASSNLALGIVNSKESFFGFLQALKNEGVARFMTQPRLITISGRSASLLSGGEQAIPVPAGLGQVGVQFEEFGTRLNFLPIVLGDGRIHLEVEPEVSALSNSGAVTISGATVQGRVTQRVHTTVELEPGQTFVLGGLIQHEDNANNTVVPVLGELPFLGVFFRSVASTEQENELLIIVTPYLVDAMDCSQLPKYLPGQETRNPDDFELFLEGILEAPRGPRAVNLNCGYTAAYKNSPSAEMYPCAGGKCGSCDKGGCTNGCASGCANGCNANGVPVNGGNCSAVGTSLPSASVDTVGTVTQTPALPPPPPAPLSLPQASRITPVGSFSRTEEMTPVVPVLGSPTPVVSPTSLPLNLPPADGGR